MPCLFCGSTKLVRAKRWLVVVAVLAAVWALLGTSMVVMIWSSDPAAVIVVPFGAFVMLYAAVTSLRFIFVCAGCGRTPPPVSMF